MRTVSDRLRRAAVRWFSAATIERVVDPLLADFESEDREAARRGSRLRRQWLRAAYGVAVAKVVCLCAAREIVDVPTSLSNEDRQALRRAAYMTVTVSALATAFLSVPPLIQQSELVGFGRMALSRFLALVAYLLPQGISIGLPLGVLVGIVGGVWGHLSLRRVGAIVLFAAALSSIAAFVNLAWIVPASNQTFRTYFFGQQVTRGISELTLPELHGLLNPGGHSPMAVERPHDMAMIAWSYHMRLMLSVAPFVFALCALATIVRSRSKTPKILVPIAAFGFYYVGLYSSRPWIVGSRHFRAPRHLGSDGCGRARLAHRAFDGDAPGALIRIQRRLIAVIAAT